MRLGESKLWKNEGQLLLNCLLNDKYLNCGEIIFGSILTNDKYQQKIFAVKIEDGIGRYFSITALGHFNFSLHISNSLWKYDTN